MHKALLLLLIFTALLSAQSVNVQLPPSQCQNNTDLLQIISTIPQCTAEAVFTSMTNGLIYSSQQLYGLSVGFLTASPDIGWFCAPYNSIMSLIESCYTILLMGAGAYYIVNSTDPEGRMKAKNWARNVFYMVVLLSFSFPIFGMIIDLNTQISSSFYASVSQNIFNINAQLSNLIFAFIFALSLSMGSYLTFITLITRYILIPFLLFLFPVAIFLYFMPITRDWGAFLFQFIILIIFMTSIDALLLMGISSLFASPDPNLANALVKSFGLIVGFGLIGIVNLVIFIIAALMAVLRAIKAFESIIAMLMRLAIILTFL